MVKSKKQEAAEKFHWEYFMGIGAGLVASGAAEAFNSPLTSMFWGIFFIAGAVLFKISFFRRFFNWLKNV